MNGQAVQDRIWRGLGQAARRAGARCRLYRARGPQAPLSDDCRVMTLDAAFAPASGWGRPQAYGEALWTGVFDGAFVRAGDYLLRPETAPGAADGGVWLVASLAPLLPPLCVRAQRIVTLSRAATPDSAGINSYGGEGAGAVLLGDWPASVLAAGGGGAYQAGLPSGTSLAAWTVLLWGSPGVVLRAGDLLDDDLGRHGVVASAELSELGWRLRVTQAAT